MYEYEKCVCVFFFVCSLFPPQQQKNLEGYVGFASLPNQVYRKSVKRGFEFTLMVVGKRTVAFRMWIIISGLVRRHFITVIKRVQAMGRVRSNTSNFLSGVERQPAGGLHS